MNRKLRYLFSIILVLCLVLTSLNINTFAAFLTFETQYEYESSNVAWLTDLVVKEDMETINGLAARTDLIAKPSYPYTETAESFSKDVGYYCSLYSLDASAGRSSILYFFTMLTGQAGAIAGDVSDDDIRTYLESVGVNYPDYLSDEELLAARALYVAMATGTYSAVTSGSSLDSVLIDFTSSLTGMNKEELEKWMPDTDTISFEDYFSATAKLTLWTNGYDVDVDTDMDTVSRYISYLTLEKIGISTNSNLSVEQMKYKYMAAMLGTKYGVSVDSEVLKSALATDSAAYYMLQLIGRSHSVAIRDGEYSLEGAFNVVAENTGIFDIEPGEFYADITDYEVQLKNKRESIWLYPTAYATNNSSYVVTVTVDGNMIKNNYYNEIALDSSLNEQTLVIKVVSTSANSESEFTYKLLVKQGSTPAEKPSSGEGDAEEGKNTFLSSDSFVAKVLEQAGMESYISSILDTAFTPVMPLAPVVRNTISFVAPSFNYESFPDIGILSGVNTSEDGKYISVLDELGSLSNTDIKGIGGIDFGGFSSLDSLRNSITF